MHSYGLYKFKYFIRYIFCSIATVICIVSIFSPGELTSQVAMLTSTIMSFYLLISVRKNWLLFFILLFLSYCLYSITVAMYFDAVVDSPFMLFAHSAYAWLGAHIILLFVTVLGFLIPYDVKAFPSEPIQSATSNQLIALLFLLLVLLSGVLGMPAANGSRLLASSTIYEYSIIFFIIGLYISGGNRKVIALYYCATVFRIYIDFATGNRIVSIEMITALFIMRLAWRLSVVRLLPFAFIGFLVFMILGGARGSVFSIENALTYLKQSFFEEYGVWDGAYAAYHTSLAVLASETRYPFTERLMNFIPFLLSISIIPFNVGGLTDVTRIANQYYWHAGGGYSPFYFHFYLGMFGVILFSIVVGIVLRHLTRFVTIELNNNILLSTTILWITSTCYRWIQYGPTQLFRGLLVAWLVAFAVRELVAERHLVFAKDQV